MFVARIHNNRLGACTSVSSVDEGVKLIQQYVKDQFNRDLTENELQELQDSMEFYDESDSDNVYSFTIGQAE
jgi:hypothetical protein